GGRGLPGRAQRGPACQTPPGSLPFKHEPPHLSCQLRVPLALPAWPGVLETFWELIQQPSCKVVLGTALFLGGGGLVLWAQRKRRQKITPELATAEHESPEALRTKESWIKSHFSCLSEEKLCTNTASACCSAPQPEGGSGEANTTIRVETFSTRQGEEGAALHRESFTSRQRMSGCSVIKETHRESGKASSSEEATWAAVAACTKEIDAKGRHLADSMLQRATAYQHSGHLESRDISPEELKALEEVEMKLKGSFLTKQESTVAGASHTHTFHPSHQGHPGHASHQSQGHPNPQSQGQPGHQSQGHQGHPGHLNYQNRPSHASYQGHPGHTSFPGHPGHLSHQSHSLPNRSH
ncbi:uncharacterized protein C10orf62 homolog, partial [Tupaia chinensis]|uniref:uncharacterized protein C10orf62 homolog n=1 Tax=Tupaia chinensis TaxID=246437 RepID=UPI000703F2A7